MGGDADRRKRQHWNLLGSVSGFAAVLAPRYVHGARSAMILVVALAATFLASTYFTFRYSPGPYRSHDSLTR